MCASCPGRGIVTRRLLACHERGHGIKIAGPEGGRRGVLQTGEKIAVATDLWSGLLIVFSSSAFIIKAVELRPNDPRAHTNYGAILHLMGRTQQAINSYRQALKLQPGDGTTLTNLAKLGVYETA